jgi:RNA polymerase sigma-70 factor (family 1)
MDKLYGENSLLGRVADGDQQAFRQVFDSYWPKVYQKAYYLLKSAELSQDLSQEVFVKIWEKREHLRNVERFDAYLFMTLRNLFIDALRKKVTEEVDIDNVDEGKLPADDADGAKKMEYRELEELIHHAIDDLPGQMQTVFRLSRFEGLTHRQIALEMNISKVTSQNYLVRALTHIRNFIATRQEKHLL